MLSRAIKIFIGLLIATIVVTIVLISRKTAIRKIDPMSVFDDSTEFFVRVNNPVNFFQCTENQSVCEFINTHLKDTNALPGFIPLSFLEKSMELYLSYQPNDGFLWILSFPDIDKSEKWTIDFIKHLSKRGEIKREKEAGNEVYWFDTQAGGNIAFFENSGIVLFTTSFDGCCKIVRKLARRNTEPLDSKSPILSTDKLASRVATANIFLNLGKYDITGFPYFSDHGWAVFDMWIKNQTILFNGLSSGLQAQGYLKMVNGLPPSKATVEAVIPSFVRSLYQLSYKKALPLSTVTKEEVRLRFRKTYGVDILEFFERVYADEIVKFTTPDQQEIIALKIKGQSTTEFNLKNMIETAERQMIEAVENTYVFDDHTRFSIYQSNWGDITGMVFGKAFSLTKAKYIVVCNDYLFVASNIDVLYKVINSNVLQQTLSGSVEFQAIKEHKASSSNILIYQQRGSETDFLPWWISDRPRHALKELIDGYAYSILWQISTDLQKPYHNIVLNFGQQKATTSNNFEWKSRLESSSVLKPATVTINPNSEVEIIVQDSTNKIYLLNQQGRIVWQKQLDGLIISDIHQVDRFKNGKQQLLFNTTSTLYLLDREGNDTENYPLSLQSPATTGLGLFDYEKDKNYRIAIPHADRTMSMTDVDGNRVEGWSFKATDAVVTTPVQHFRVGTKDYLLLGDTLRIYILDRRGDQRIKPTELRGKSMKSPFYYSPSRNRWFTSTHQGQLMSISIDGTVRHEKLFDVSNDHVYIYADLSSDGKGNHIFLDQNRLIVADNQGKHVFTHVFRGQIIDFPSIYRFSAKKRGLGIVDRTDKKVFLFDQNGKQFPGFPKHGITPFTITRFTNENDYHLLVGHIDGFIYDIKIE